MGKSNTTNNSISKSCGLNFICMKSSFISILRQFYAREFLEIQWRLINTEQKFE